MRIGIKLVHTVRQPESTICVKDLFAETREELLKDTTAINTRSFVMLGKSLGKKT
jgi:hypothetical protein